MVADLARLLARWLASRRVDIEPPSLPLLTHLPEAGAADWLREVMTTFATSVASFLPGHFEAYVRIYHPFEFIHGTASWREVAAAAGVDLHDPAVAEEFAFHGVDAQPRIGTLPIELVGPLVEHLRPATTTPESCFFACIEAFLTDPRLETVETTAQARW